MISVSVDGDGQVIIGMTEILMDSKIQGKVTDFPLTRFVITVSHPSQAMQVMELSENAMRTDFMRNESYSTSKITIVLCSEKRVHDFEQALQKIAGIYYIKTPCPAVSEEGLTIEVIDVLPNKILVRDSEKVRSVSRDNVIFDDTMGYYIVKMNMSKDEVNRINSLQESIKKVVREKKEFQEKKDGLDAFDFL